MQSKPQSGYGVGYSGYWSYYKNGIDDSNGFWLGLDEMHKLTKSGRYGLELAIELAADSYEFVNWPLLVIGNEASKYEATISSDDGVVYAKGRNAGGNYYFVSQNGLRFSSRDLDYDTWSGTSCATHSSYGDYTGWWYSSCSWHWNHYKSTSTVYTGKKTRMTMISRIGNCQPYQISLQMKVWYYTT